MTARTINNEKLLLSRLGAGDMDAFTALYRHYQPRLQQRLAPFCSTDDAENIIQEVFLKVWLKKSIIAQVDAFEGLLVKMAKNQLVDMRRKAASTDRKESLAASLTPTQTDARQLELKELQTAALQVIARLPPRQRDIFTLRVLEEQSLDEIVKKTGLSKPVVIKQLYLASKTVRAEVKQFPLFSFLLHLGGGYLFFPGIC